jgi:uncharacterized protein YkwD
MFKKTWKQIKFFTILIILLICLPHSILPHRVAAPEKDDLEKYKRLNENEQRLIEFKDNDEALNLKLEQLALINNSRRKYNAAPVSLDILASRVANKMCKEAADNAYIGHWDLAGEEPYLRYAFAGGHDHVSENAYGEWSTGNYSVSPSTISSMMKSGHSKFMAERVPNNGHKENIINKAHNYVGIGYYLAGKQFRYYEEFIDRYLEFENIPSSLNTGSTSSITVKTNGSFLYYMIIYREKFPNSLSPSEISRRGSYMDFTNEIYKEVPAWELSRYRNGNIYTIPVSFSKEGLFYIQLYSDKKEFSKPTSLSTKGKNPESGIVIKVNKQE